MARRKKTNDLIKIAEMLLKPKGRRSSKGGGVLKTLVGLVLLLLLGLVLLLQDSTPGETYQVERCVDGDTIIILDQGEQVRVRLIGANTPETKKPHWDIERFGPEASAFTKQAVEQAGNRVRLEYDGTKTDRYGRTLAHVYVGDKLLSEELIRAGLATAELQYSYSQSMKNRLQAAEYEAQKARRGIWSTAP